MSVTMLSADRIRLCTEPVVKNKHGSGLAQYRPEKIASHQVFFVLAADHPSMFMNEVGSPLVCSGSRK